MRWVKIATEAMPTQLQAPQATKSSFLGTLISTSGARHEDSSEKEPEIKWVTLSIEFIGFCDLLLFVTTVFI